MWKRTSPLCSACIEAKDMNGRGDGGHACTCEFDYSPTPTPNTFAIGYDLADVVTWRHGHRPVGLDWDTAIVEGINYADGIAEVSVQDGSRPYEMTLETEKIWIGALYKKEN